MPSEPLLAVDATPGDPGNDGSAPQGAAAVGEFVAFVGMQLGGSPTNSPDALPDRRHRVDQWDQRLDDQPQGVGNERACHPPAPNSRTPESLGALKLLTRMNQEGERKASDGIGIRMENDTGLVSVVNDTITVEGREPDCIRRPAQSKGVSN
jgi:hypothetical protein